VHTIWVFAKPVTYAKNDKLISRNSECVLMSDSLQWLFHSKQSNFIAKVTDFKYFCSIYSFSLDNVSLLYNILCVLG